MATENGPTLRGNTPEPDTYSYYAHENGLEPIGRDCADTFVYAGTIVIDAGRDPYRVVSASKSVEGDDVFITADQHVLIQSLVAVID